jgi:hypothetical protein
LPGWGAVTCHLSDRMATCRWRTAKKRVSGSTSWLGEEKNQGLIKLFSHVLPRMHEKKDKKKLMSPLHATCLKLKKSINHKSNIKIKFRSHYWISDNKNFETRSHLTIFWQKNLFYFLIKVIYFVIARTKRMKCQNKREQLQNKFICHSEQQMSEQIRIRVRHKLLL